MNDESNLWCLIPIVIVGFFVYAVIANDKHVAREQKYERCLKYLGEYDRCTNDYDRSK